MDQLERLLLGCVRWSGRPDADMDSLAVLSDWLEERGKMFLAVAIRKLAAVDPWKHQTPAHRRPAQTAEAYEHVFYDYGDVSDAACPAGEDHPAELDDCRLFEVFTTLAIRLRLKTHRRRPVRWQVEVSEARPAEEEVVIHASDRLAWHSRDHDKSELAPLIRHAKWQAACRIMDVDPQRLLIECASECVAGIASPV